MKKKIFEASYKPVHLKSLKAFVGLEAIYHNLSRNPPRNKSTTLCNKRRRNKK
jgi:hypothetical protein